MALFTAGSMLKIASRETNSGSVKEFLRIYMVHDISYCIQQIATLVSIMCQMNAIWPTLFIERLN